MSPQSLQNQLPVSPFMHFQLRTRNFSTLRVYFSSKLIGSCIDAALWTEKLNLLNSVFIGTLRCQKFWVGRRPFHCFLAFSFFSYPRFYESLKIIIMALSAQGHRKTIENIWVCLSLLPQRRRPSINIQKLSPSFGTADWELLRLAQLQLFWIDDARGQVWRRKQRFTTL